MKKFEKIINRYIQQRKSSTMIHNYIRDKKIVVYGFGQGFITFNEFVIKKLNLPVSIIIDKKFKSDTLVNNASRVSEIQ